MSAYTTSFTNSPGDESKARAKKKEKPPELDLHDFRSAAGDNALKIHSFAPPIAASTSDHTADSETDLPRSTSATSSLDPYYFTVPSSTVSPIPPLPESDSNSDFDSRIPSAPFTPARDPASIDRNGLVGVGELHTPRWAKVTAPRSGEDGEREGGEGERSKSPFFEFDVRSAPDDDDRGSPWTIEAVDGEGEGDDAVEHPEHLVPVEERLVARSLRSRPSAAEESGGEEILYPRKPHINNDILKELPPLMVESTDSDSMGFTSKAKVSPPTSPPSSFLSPVRKAKKRSSDEFALDQSGFLIPKLPASSSNVTVQTGDMEDKSSTRKHHSYALGSSSSSATVRDRRRTSSVRMSLGSSSKSSLVHTRSVKHSRQHSVSSSSSTQDLTRREQSTTNLSNLPPSPAVQGNHAVVRLPLGPSSKQSMDKLSIIGKEKDAHSSPNVAHSLLRGTQEGWLALDDDATAEALRKLDGISGKSTRSRGSLGIASRASSHSRPGTPGTTRGHRSDGTESSDALRRRVSNGGLSNTTPGRSHERIRHEEPFIDSDKEDALSTEQSTQGTEVGSHAHPSGLALETSGSENDQSEALIMAEKEVRKSLPPAVRSSFTQKRSSASSTNYTGTPTSSSRDSASMSTATSATSASVASGRFSSGKVRRNSAGSDISSVHSNDAASQRDRVASLIAGEGADGNSVVPPVPPLPKDLSYYKSPPQSSASLLFPGLDHGKDMLLNEEVESTRSNPLEVPSVNEPEGFLAIDSGLEEPRTMEETPKTPSSISKTPSKKWSFTSALSLRRSSSPGHDSSTKSSNGKTPQSSRSNRRLQGTTWNDFSSAVISPKSSVEAWQNIQKGAMNSETSLASLSSANSVPEVSPPPSPSHAIKGVATRNIERGGQSRSGTASSGSTNHASSAFLDSGTIQGSPSSKSHRDSTNKRLTPSSIPFFRRSSSQSMQIPPSSATTATSTSPTFSLAPNLSKSAQEKGHRTPGKVAQVISPTTPGSQRKSSMLSLGLPSLLKGSSSRKSLHIDKSQTMISDYERGKQKDSENEKSKLKKDDKDRSESRISILMGRKRGKTLSSTDQKKPKPIVLPPMQLTALPPSTTERLANVKATSASSSTSSITRTPSTSGTRATSQTISSLQKQSDASLRSSRSQLPTIAGSPSVGTQAPNQRSQSQEQREVQLPTSLASSSLTKETPTRIPRIASRSSTVTSPPLKSHSSLLPSRRTSMNVGALGMHVTDPSFATEESMNEFGVLENAENGSKRQPSSTSTVRQSFGSSPMGNSKGLRLASGFSASSSASVAHPRKSIHDSISVKGLRKSSTGSVSSMASTAGLDAHQRLTGSSPSKGINKLLSPKMSLPGSRLSGSSTTPNIHQQQSSGSPSGRQSISTPSPIASSVDEDEILGDEEMMQYIRRTQARKLASGAKKEELDGLLKFPEPIPPARPSSPENVLKSELGLQLSDFERKEILDFPSVYFVSNKENKKLATREVSTNNYGYDDDRGDYLVINNDHLAYRYEIIDTLGKGSFGQVLHCRDHCTGESVAIKIIRNKKRFHHQALVEIKILENLRKWDPDEKHHVIKMTEHFYFRNHLCIAMELLSINLYELIKANGFAGFSTTLIRRFTSQMLLSLSLMRHHRIVHCDLKPENVLLRHPTKSGLKVIDFGSSCFEHEKVYTYIQSRFYRSPEVILGMNYNMAIDMWSLGCILAELYTGYPIFPGENEQEQLSCIMEVLGVPEKDVINRSSRKRLFFDSTGAPRPVVNSKGRRRRAGTKTLAQVLRCDDELFVDFVSKCLHWDPERRMKPQSAMRHPFITAGRRARIINNTGTPSSSRTHGSSSSLLSSGRLKLAETPKKSQISAPTPLAARNARAPTTPVSSHSHAAPSTSKSYRTSQISYQTSRSMNTFAVASAK